jgi:hypothetical protein
MKLECLPESREIYKENIIGVTLQIEMYRLMFREALGLSLAKEAAM